MKKSKTKETPSSQEKDKRTLLSCFVAFLPFFFISPFFFLTPKFEQIFEELLPGDALPQLTQLIIYVPGYTGIIISTIFAYWNYNCIKKEKKGILLSLSIIFMLALTAMIFYGLFDPITIIIKELKG